MATCDTPPTDSADALDWLALQFLLRELPPAETERFEARLGTELAAAEALARATRLYLGAHAALPAAPRVATAPARPARRLRDWLAVSMTAAALALVAVIAAPPADTDGLAQRSPAARLVDGWRTQGADEAADAWTADADDEAAEPRWNHDAVPDWMLAAVGPRPARDVADPAAAPSESSEAWQEN